MAMLHKQRRIQYMVRDHGGIACKDCRHKEGLHRLQFVTWQICRHCQVHGYLHQTSDDRPHTTSLSAASRRRLQSSCMHCSCGKRIGRHWMKILAYPCERS